MRAVRQRLRRFSALRDRLAAQRPGSGADVPAWWPWARRRQSTDARIRRPERGRGPPVPSRRRDAWSCRSSAARRSPIPTASGPSPTTSCAPAAPATTSSWWSRPWARPPTTSSGSPTTCPPARPAARWTCCSPPGERISIALLCMAIIDRGEPAVSLHRLAGRDRHRHRPRARPRSSRSGPTASARRIGGRERRGRRRVPGRVDRTRHHHARPRRLRHHRGRARGRARRRGVRDLHRRRRASSPPTRASCPTRAGSTGVSYDEMLEMAATGGRVLALRSVEFARNHGVPVHVRSSFTWEPGTWVDRGGAEHGTADHLRRHARHSEAKVTIFARARPARHRRAGCSARWPTKPSTST